MPPPHTHTQACLRVRNAHQAIIIITFFSQEEEEEEAVTKTRHVPPFWAPWSKEGGVRVRARTRVSQTNGAVTNKTPRREACVYTLRRYHTQRQALPA